MTNTAEVQYTFSITGLSLHLWRPVSNGYEWHMPSCDRRESDSEVKKKQLLFYLLFQTEMLACYFACASHQNSHLDTILASHN